MKITYTFGVCFLLLYPLWLGPFLSCTEGPLTYEEPNLPPPPAAATVRGMMLDARRIPPPSTLPQLHSRGVQYLSVTPYGTQSRADEPIIRTNYNTFWYSESDQGIKELATQSSSQNLQIIITPKLWIRSGAWTADIRFETEEDWSMWEAHYRAFILHYAELSEHIGAPICSIGAELAHSARSRPTFWRSLIEDVRKVYKGKLTYGANWYEEYEHLSFWDALDYIGIQAYFPLSESPNPSLSDLKAGWIPHKEAMLHLQRRVGKPILFTEIGYRSISYAAAKPWAWASNDELNHASPDYELQARLYEAFFQTFWPEPWFAGMFFWKWTPEVEKFNSLYAIDFTPQGKPAEQVLVEWLSP